MGKMENMKTYFCTAMLIFTYAGVLFVAIEQRKCMAKIDKMENQISLMSRALDDIATSIHNKK